MANRLAEETSPYLIQHKDNPVDWLPWGPEALGRAAQEDKPILLSIGYSACHWCHVMEHESFELAVSMRLTELGRPLSRLFNLRSVRLGVKQQFDGVDHVSPPGP